MKKFWLLVIFSLCLFFRLLWLDRFPTGILNDENHFVLTAKSVFLGFSDLSGTWKPLSLTTTPDNPSSELIFSILAPILGPLPTNLFTARLPFALFSALFSAVILLIGWEIKPKIGIIAGLISIINPWFFYTGRTAFDVPIALFMLTLSFYCLLKLKGKLLILSLIPLLLGFYTYIGTKVIFLPYVLFICYIVWLKNNKKYFSSLLIVLLVSFLAVISHTLNTLTQPSRLGELITPASSKITSQVETEMAQSIPCPAGKLFINRYILFSYHFAQKYLQSFSPSLFFTKGDETYLVSFWKHGYFYYLDLLFMFIGIYYLYQNHRRFFWPLLIIILLSPIPEAIRADTMPAFAFHCGLYYPFFLIFIAAGIYAFIQKFPKTKFLIFLIYLILFANLLFLYFFRYPVYQPEGFAFSNRLATLFLQLQSQTNQPIIFITSEPESLFKQYLFYTNELNSQNLSTIQNTYLKTQGEIVYKNLRFTREKIQDITNRNTIYITESSYHHLNQPRQEIDRLNTSLEVFSIYNSQVCPDNPKPYLHPTVYSKLLSPDKLSTKEFCTSFVFTTPL